MKCNAPINQKTKTKKALAEMRATRFNVWVAAAAFFLSNILYLIVSGGDLDTSSGSHSGGMFLTALGYVNLFAYVYFIKTSVRRLHDMNRSGWWVLPSVVPTIASTITTVVSAVNGSNNAFFVVCDVCAILTNLATVVWLGFAKGTQGPNKYGPAPHAGAIVSDGSNEENANKGEMPGRAIGNSDSSCGVQEFAADDACVDKSLSQGIFRSCDSYPADDYWKCILFTQPGHFKGRASRKKLWGVWVKATLCYVVACLIVNLITSRDIVSVELGMAVLVALQFTIGICTVPVAVRRLHDRGLSGKAMIPCVCLSFVCMVLAWSGDGASFVGVLVSIMASIYNFCLFVLLGFIRGTRGSNKYGPDPLEKVSLKETSVIKGSNYPNGQEEFKASVPSDAEATAEKMRGSMAVGSNDVSKCAKCGSELAIGARFCCKCGKPVSVIRDTSASKSTNEAKSVSATIKNSAAAYAPKCAGCGTDLVAGMKFCGECGAPVNA